MTRTWNRFFLVSLTMALLMGLASSYFFSEPITTGLLTGMIFMIGNFYILRKMTTWFLEGSGKKIALSTTILVLKFGASLTLVWAVMKWVPLQPLAFGVGIVAVPFLFAITTLGHPEASQA